MPGNYKHRQSPTAWQRRQDLRAVAQETKDVLPDILSQVDAIDATASSIHHLRDLQPLESEDCPGYILPEDDAEAGRKGTRIRVYDQDTFETAIQIQPGTTVQSAFGTQEVREEAASRPEDGEQDADPATSSTSRTSPKPVALLNLASERHPGGGWLNGALAQEEALCYRSSLSLSLHHRYYPIPSLSALYTPHVLVIRSTMPQGHALLFPETGAAGLPLTSVITAAALRRPEVAKGGDEGHRFAKAQDREMTKDKIRLVLRVAAHQGHGKIVLGAMGCGAFGNPPKDVANCFLEVLQEQEFQGGWWEEVAFAVLDNARGDRGGKDGVGNFGIFYRTLDGVIV